VRVLRGHGAELDWQRGPLRPVTRRSRSGSSALTKLTGSA